MTTLYVQRILASDLGAYVTYQTEIPTTSPTVTTPASTGPYDSGTHEILQRYDSLHLKVFPPVATSGDLPTGSLVDEGAQCWVVDDDAMYYANAPGGTWAPAAGGGGGPLAGDVVGAFGSTTVQRIQGVNFPVGPYVDGQLVGISGGTFAVQSIGGDISGTTPALVVNGIRGVAVDVAAASPTSGDLIAYDGAAYNVITLEDLINSTTPGVEGDLDGTLPNPTVVGFAGTPIEQTSPVQGQFYQFDDVANSFVLRPAPYADVTLAVNEAVTADLADVEIVVGGMRILFHTGDYVTFYADGYITPAESGSMNVKLYLIPPAVEDPEVLMGNLVINDGRFDHAEEDLASALAGNYDTFLNLEVRVVLTATSIDTVGKLLKAGIRVDQGGVFIPP